MGRSKKMSRDMQIAAVRSAREGGKSLDEIEKDYPDLKDGVAALREEAQPATPAPAPRGSGSSRAMSSMTRRPTL